MHDEAERFVSASTAAWTHLVSLCLATPVDRTEQLACALAASTHGLKQTFKRKIRAVHDANLSGMDREQIIAAGQNAILSRFAKANGFPEPQRVLRWRVSRSLADAIMCETTNLDGEEADVTRIKRVCGIETSEEYWEFMHALVLGMTDDQLQNHAGGDFAEKKKRPKSRA
jgi:hypothetical protein